jgi:two-component system competent response regulator ComA
MIKILLVDDHPAVMEGTKIILEQEGGVKVFPAHSAGEACEKVEQMAYDVMLIDLNLSDGNGIDLAKRVLKLRPESTILIYTGFDVSNHFNLMIESGLCGFIPKTSNSEQLLTAVRCALRGEVVLPLSLVRQLRRTTLQAAEPNNSSLVNLAISHKEYEILKQIAKGKSNKDIAEFALMSQRSLEYALTNLFVKLGVKSRIEAAIKAKQLGFLSDADFMP